MSTIKNNVYAEIIKLFLTLYYITDETFLDEEGIICTE